MHGPEIGFARALAAAGIDNVAIIKVAANIPHPPERDAWPWSKGDKQASPDFYGQWQTFVRDRLAELEAKGNRVRVAGFVWHQGIDDGINGESEATYADRLRKLIADLRADYNCPDAPFLVVRSVNSTIATPAAMAPIRAAQVRAAEETHRAAWIDIDDQPTVNRHHLTAEAQLEVGRRLGQAWLKRAQDKSAGTR